MISIAQHYNDVDTTGLKISEAKHKHLIKIKLVPVDTKETMHYENYAAIMTIA